jgi:methylated-DNA-[protein]-cysteine S-methyltransferase
MDQLYTSNIRCRLGYLIIEGSEQYVQEVRFSDEQPDTGEPNEVTNRCANQLWEYFAGERREFDVPVHARGTEFQVRVWEELMKVPFGHQVTYLELAEAIGGSSLARAVGMASAKNRISIIVPCHRVVGSSGKLTGYAAGLWRKDWLLKHERLVAGVEHQLDLFF